MNLNIDCDMAFSLVSLVLSAINITITIMNWYTHRPKLKINTYDVTSFYEKNLPDKFNYSNSDCIYFVYAKISNKSYNPATISEVELEFPDKTKTFASKRAPIRDEYRFNFTHVTKNMCLELPLTIPPNNYAEGYIVFPYAGLPRDKTFSAKLKFFTPKKEYNETAEIYSGPSTRSFG